jgi:hypothetical protein
MGGRIIEDMGIPTAEYLDLENKDKDKLTIEM